MFDGGRGGALWDCNGLLMLTSGHLVNNPSIHVLRWWSLSAIAMAVVTAICCVRFGEKYKLTLLDKSALMTWLLTFVLAVNAENVQTVGHHVVGAAIMWVGCVAVVIAWVVNRRTSHKKAIPSGSTPLSIPTRRIANGNPRYTHDPIRLPVSRGWWCNRGSRALYNHLDNPCAR